MRVTVQIDDSLEAARRALVRRAGLAVLLRRCGDELGVAARHGLAIRLTTDDELRRLNREFAGVDAATDVLAFGGSGEHVGDIAISVPRAMAQSDDPVAELRLLAVHGLLHCLGHDHAEPSEAARMTEETRRLLPDQAVPELQAH